MPVNLFLTHIMMDKQELDELLDKFIEAEKRGQSIYLDSDQIEEILDILEDEEDFELYDRLLAAGLKMHPESTQLLIKKSKVLMCDEEFEKALLLINQLKETESGELYAIQINCLFATNQKKQAYKILNRLTEENFDELETVYEFVSTFLNEMYMNDEASDVISKGITLFPKNIYLKNELCFLLETSNDIPKAIQICQELIDASPYSAEHWFTLGRLYTIIGEYNKAIEAFDFVATCSSEQNDYELKILKAYCFYMNTNYESAISIYKELIEIDDLKKRIAPLMAECYIKMGEYEESYLLMNPIINKENDCDVSTYLNYIRCCMETGRESEAQATIHEAVNTFPQNINLLSLQAISFLEMKEIEKAIATAKKMLEILDLERYDLEQLSCNNNADTLFRLAQRMHKEDDIEQALHYYKEAKKADPGLKFINLYMAIAYLQKRDMDNFAECIKHISSEEMQKLITETPSYNIEKDALSSITEMVSTAKLAKEYLKNKSNNN